MRVALLVGLALLAGCMAPQQPATDTWAPAPPEPLRSQAMESWNATGPSGPVSFFVHADAPLDRVDRVQVSVRLAVHGTCSTGWHQTAPIEVDLQTASGDKAAFMMEQEAPCPIDAVRLDFGPVHVTQEGRTHQARMLADHDEARTDAVPQPPGEQKVVLRLALSDSLRHDKDGWRFVPVLESVAVREVDDLESGDEAMRPGDVGDA